MPMGWFLARCGITAALLAVLVWQLGAHSIIERVWTLSLGSLALVAFVLAVQLLLSAWRWKALVDHFGSAKVSTADLCWFLGASHFYGEFLPSTIGGDVVRTAMLSQRAGVGPATLSVILDRITGLAMLLLMIVGLLPLLGCRIEQGSAFVGLAVLGIGGMLAIGVLLMLRHRVVPGWLPGPVALVPELAGYLRQALFSRTLAPQVVGSGLLIQLLSVILFFLLSRAIGVPLPFLDCLLLVPPALLISALPVSLAGWGVREGALAGGFALVGAAPADVVAVSILYGLTSPAIGVVYAMLSFLRR
jgi:glycosyltransferase 2 family protein